MCAWRSASQRSAGTRSRSSVVVVVPLGVKDSEAVTDRDARGDDQEALGEAGVFGRHHLVDGLPGDEHGHDDRLACAGCHLQPDSGQPVVVQTVLGLEATPVVGGAVPAGDFGEEDRRLGSLPLAEEDRLVTSRGLADQWASSLRVYGVTPFQFRSRQRSTSRRMSLMRVFCSRRSPVASKSKACCASFLPLVETGIGMNDSLGRRPSFVSPVGPCGPITKCWLGGS